MMTEPVESTGATDFWSGLRATTPSRPRVDLADADRNCVSDIHPPGGLGYRPAAQVTAGLVAGARGLGRSGVG